MKLVFFGSPVEAVASLPGVRARGHEVVAVYTRPDRAAGRSSAPLPTPVRAAAEVAGILVRTPKSLRDPAVQAELRAFGADAFIVVAYGRLLPAEVLAVPRLGVLNVHPSLLPAYRGPSPVQQAILDGAEVTGVSVMLLDEGMDTGPVLAQTAVRLSGDETGGSLTASLFELGATLLADTLERYARGEVKAVPQDSALAMVTRLLAREDGEIDWTQPAARIARMVRAYDPWPGTHTRWQGQVLKVLEATAQMGINPAVLIGERSPAVPGTVTVEEEVARTTAGPDLPPGTVLDEGTALLIATGEGAILVQKLQLEGRKAASAADFLRGHPEIVGATLPS